MRELSRNDDESAESIFKRDGETGAVEIVIKLKRRNCGVGFAANAFQGEEQATKFRRSTSALPIPLSSS